MAENFSDQDDVVAVSGWRASTVEARNLVVLRLPFITGPHQHPESATTDRVYALTLDQADEISSALAAAVQELRRASRKN